MRVTIVGTGNMARGIAARALAGGHHVAFLGTHPSRAPELADELSGMGAVSATEAFEGDMVMLAVPYTDAPHVLRAHAGELDGLVVVDVTDPVDLGRIEPLDRGYVAPFGSAAQLLADVAGEGTPVVRAFNVAGDDEDAKALVCRLARDGGLRSIDAGPLARARELEATGCLHMAIQASLGSMFSTALAVLP